MTNIWLVSAVLYSASCILICILLVLVTYQLLKGCRSRDKLNAFDVALISVQLLITLIFACSALDTFRLYDCWMHDKPLLGTHDALFKSLCDTIYSIQDQLFIIILFTRLIFVFKHSAYALSKRWIMCISFQIVLSIAFTIVNLINMILFNDIVDTVYDLLLYIAIIVNEFTVSISMVILFSLKLRKLIISNKIANQNRRDRIKSLSINENADTKVTKQSTYETFKTISRLESIATLLPDSKPSKLSDISRKLSISEKDHIMEYVVVMTRHSLLCTLAICFNQLYYLMVVAYFVTLFYDTQIWESRLFGVLMYGIRIFGSIGVAITLIFTMFFAKRAYFRCCWICHLMCFRCCLKCIP